MEQKCENCKWYSAPCHFGECKTLNPKKCGNKDYWTPARPWEEKWIVPEGCSGYFSHDHEYLFGYAHGWPSVWSLLNGNCTMTSYGSGAPNLIPKTPPIEETAEFKAFCEVHPISERNIELLLDEYKRFNKIFKMELK